MVYDAIKRIVPRTPSRPSGRTRGSFSRICRTVEVYIPIFHPRNIVIIYITHSDTFPPGICAVLALMHHRTTEVIDNIRVTEWKCIALVKFDIFPPKKKFPPRPGLSRLASSQSFIPGKSQR